MIKKRFTRPFHSLRGKLTLILHSDYGLDTVAFRGRMCRQRTLYL